MRGVKYLKYGVTAVLALLVVATVLISVPQEYVTLRSGVAAGYVGDPYVAYVDFSGLWGKIVLLNAASGDARVVSEPGYDAQRPAFAGNWLMWREIGEEDSRIVWLNVSSGEKVTLELGAYRVYCSASEYPTYLAIEGETAVLYRWSESGFVPVLSRNVTDAEAYCLRGEEGWYSINGTVYSLSTGEPLCSFGEGVKSFVVVNGRVVASVPDEDQYALMYWNGSSTTVLGTYNMKISYLSALEANGDIYIVFQTGVDRGKRYDDCVVFMHLPDGRGEGLAIREITKSGTDFYRPTMASDGETVYLCYITFGDFQWRLILETISDGVTLSSDVLKRAEPIGVLDALYLLSAMGGTFLTIFGMIPMDKESRKVPGTKMLPIRAFISYEPYRVLKFLSFGTLVLLFMVVAMAIGTVGDVPADISMRYYPFNIIASFALLFSAVYLIFFFRERKASTVHTAAYTTAGITLPLTAVAFYRMYFGSYLPAVDISAVLYSLLALILVLLVQYLTLIGLTRVKNMWLLVVGELLLFMPVLLTPTNLSRMDFYPSPGAFYVALGEAPISFIFLAITYVFIFGGDILLIAKEHFKPVTEWDLRDYMTCLHSYLVVYILGLIPFILSAVFFGVGVGPLGLLTTTADSKLLLPMVGIITGMLIFLTLIMHKTISASISKLDNLMVRPSKTIFSAMSWPLLAALCGMVASIFFGLLSFVFLLISLYEAVRAYRTIRGEILKRYGKEKLEEKLARAEKEEKGAMELVSVNREFVNKCMKNLAKKTVRVAILVSVMLLFLWKFMDYTPEPVINLDFLGMWKDVIFSAVALTGFLTIPVARWAIRKKGNLYDLLRRVSNAETFIAISLVSPILVGMVKAHPGIVIMGIASGLLSTVYMYRLRTTELARKIESMPQEDLKLPALMLVYYMAGECRERSSDPFRATGYSSGTVDAGTWDVKPPHPREHGSLLAEEPEAYRKGRERALRTFLAVFPWIFSPGALVLFLFILPAEQLSLAIGAVVGVSSVLSLLIWALWKPKLEPVRFYENGVEFSTPFGTKVFAYYFCLSKNVITGMWGSRVILRRGTGPAASLMLSLKMWPGLEKVLEKVEDKMLGLGTADGVEIGDREGYDRAYSRMFLVIFLASCIALTGSSVAVFGFDGLAFIIASIFGALLLYAVLHIAINTPGNIFGVKPRIHRNYVAIAAALVGALLVAGYYAPIAVPSDYTPLKDMPGDLDVISTSITATVINLNRSISLSGTVGLVDVRINVTAEGVGIYVAEGASVTMENVTITGKAWRFESYGELAVYNSTFENMWGDTDRVNWQGGMEIYECARFINCTFRNATTNALMVHGTAVEVRDSCFNSTGDEGIEISDGKLYVENASFENCEWAITAFNAEVTVDRCTFVSCPHAICLTDGSRGEVRDTSFVECGIGVDITDGSSAHLENLKFEGTDREVRDTSRDMNVLCVTFTAPIVLVVVGYSFYIAVKSGRVKRVNYDQGLER